VQRLPAKIIPVQRLGKNVGGYRGEGIDIENLRQRMDRAIAGKNWIRDGDFLGLRRPAASPRNRVYLSAGIHGDEPAGPLALLQLLEEDRWPEDAALWVCPCLNPAGLALNQRENAQGIDLNRDYRHLLSAEVREHVAWLEQLPRLDLALCLHEDWEAQGFYLYEMNPDARPSLAEKMVERVATICPIDLSPLIEGREAQNGILRPQIQWAERPQWPEGFYLITHLTRLSYTLEAPSDFPLPVRVAALMAAVRLVLELL
jgi:murein peptide amidase A